MNCQLILVSLLIAAVHCETTKTAPDSSQQDAVDGPLGRAATNDTVAMIKEKTRSLNEEGALKDALIREQQLKQELSDTKQMLARSQIPIAPNAQPSQMQMAPNGQPIQPQQQGISPAKLFGPNGIMQILNPKIMDQQDAASKLIPALSVPSAQLNQARPGFNQQQQFPQQTNQFPQQQMTGNQMPFGQQQQPFMQQQPQFGQQQQPMFNQFPAAQQQPAMMPQQGFQQQPFSGLGQNINPNLVANPFPAGQSFGGQPAMGNQFG